MLVGVYTLGSSETSLRSNFLSVSLWLEFRALYTDSHL